MLMYLFGIYCFYTSPFDILYIIRYIMYGFLGHLCHLGDLLLWVSVRRHPSSVARRVLTSSSQELLDQYSPNLVSSICRVMRQEIVTFMTPLSPRKGEVILW